MGGWIATEKEWSDLQAPLQKMQESSATREKEEPAVSNASSATKTPGASKTSSPTNPDAKKAPSAAKAPDAPQAPPATKTPESDAEEADEGSERWEGGSLEEDSGSRRPSQQAAPPADAADSKEGLDPAGAARAAAVIGALRSATSKEVGASSDGSASPSPKGKAIWKRVSNMYLTRVNDAAMIMRKTPQKESVVTFDDSQLTRVSLRLDGMDSYSVLGALISGFSLQLISAVQFDDFDTSFRYFFAVLFVLFGTLTTVFALYATIIFALCSLHGKAGIGMHKDEGYLKYITLTASYRESAFVALMSCFAGIVATLMCMLFLKTPVVPACLGTAAAASFCAIAKRHVQAIMQLATEHVFT